MDHPAGRSNDVDYLDAGMRFDTVLTFLALRWSLDMSEQGTFPMLLSLKRSRGIRTELLLESLQPRSVRIERVPGNFPG